jgi:DNA-binding transcriptional regulator YdaS (Cro superfamily)
MGTTLRDYLWMHRSLVSSQEFADKLGISRFHLSRISNGVLIPSKRLARDIEKATGGAVPYSNYHASEDEKTNSRII